MATALATYAPDFQIRINDADLPASVRSVVTGVRYQDGQNESDRVELNLANPNLQWLQKHIKGLGFQAFPTGIKVGSFAQLDAAPEGTFDIDNKLSLAMGYAGASLEEMFEGDITGIDVTFPSGGMPTMKLVAQDYLSRLNQGTLARGFGMLPDFLIASIISAESFLIPAIDPAITAASTALAAVNFIFSGSGEKQGAPAQGQSNLAMLKQIADKYDADFWVDRDTLYLSRFNKSYTTDLTLTYGESLIEFSPHVSTVGQVAGVSMRFTLREVPLDFVVTVSWNFDHERLEVSVLPGIAAKGAKAVSGPNLTIVDQSISSPGDVASSALKIIRELRNKLNGRLTGNGSAIGNPRIRAGALIRLDGLGPDFSGDYRVKSASHSIDTSGYRTTFDVFKEIIP